jgi:hypothetical protein
MIQCEDCEYFQRGPDGAVVFSCDPFSTVKEPACLTKWQLLKLESLVRAYQATLAVYQKLAPMQEKMFRHMEREIDDMEESESWRESLKPDDELDDDLDDDCDHPIV